MNKERNPEALKLLPTLAALEQDVVAEYWELDRQKLERRLATPRRPDRRAFPPAPKQTLKPDAAD